MHHVRSGFKLISAKSSAVIMHYLVQAEIHKQKGQPDCKGRALTIQENGCTSLSAPGVLWANMGVA